MLAVGAAVMLAGCERPAPEVVEVVRPVKFFTVGGSNSGRLQVYPGTLEASQSTEMSFEVVGRIIELPINEGQIVQRGQVLAKLDDRDYQARYDRAVAALNQARADLRRRLEVYEINPGAIAPAELDAFRQSVESADATVRVDRKALEDTVLRAPFDGRVAKRYFDNFANVQAKEPVLLLEDDLHMQVVIDVPEADIARSSRNLDLDAINARAKPTVSVTSLPGQVWPARITEFASSADPTTRTFAVTLVFEAPEETAVFPGMTARVSATVVNDDVMRVPLAATFSAASGQTSVWRIDPDTLTVSQVDVTLGELAGDSALVLTGLQPGDVIATSGVRHLREGMQVKRYVFLADS